MKKISLLLLLLMIMSLACNISGNLPNSSQEEETKSENRCGDNVCDGPENSDNCPQDCKLGNLKLDESVEDTQNAPVEQEAPDSGYRFVSFSGTIKTAHNTATMGDFTGRIIEYGGDYSINLWFPLEGGQAVQQKNTIALTDYQDWFMGNTDCLTCQWTLDESAYAQVSFELDTSLNLNAMKEGDEPADELVYQLVQVPTHNITGEVICCGAPGPINDPAGIPTLAGWFMQKLVNPIHLNVLETNTVEDFPVSPIYFVDIPMETLSYTIVPDLNTP